MQLTLNCILFCFILLLCAISFASGLFFGYKKKEAEKPKIDPKILTEEQERQIKKRQREEENFWNYDGNTQETI